MSVHPEHRQVGVAPGLGGQDRDGRAVVAAEHGQECGGRHLGEQVRHRAPALLHRLAEIQVPEVVDPERRQRAAALVHGRNDRGETADRGGALGRALPVDRRTVVGDSRHDHAGLVSRCAGQAGPGVEPRHLDHRARRSRRCCRCSCCRRRIGVRRCRRRPGRRRR